MKRIILVILVIVAFSLSGFAGIEWTNKIVSKGKKKRDNNEMIMKIAAQDGIVRQDFVSVKKKRGMAEKGTYWLFNAKDDMIYVVNPEDKEVTPMSLEYMLNMSQMASKLVKIKIKDYSASSKSLGTEKVNGVTCKHVKLITDYTMKIKIAFVKKTIIMHEEKEIWGSKGVKGLNHLNAMFLNKDLKTGFEDLDKMIKKQMAQNRNIGFPMKTRVRQIHKSKKGKVKSDITTISTVENLKSKKFPKSYFEIPKGYSVSKPLEGPKS